MALSLSKNQTISLEKTAGSGLQRVTMGLGWDVAKPKGFLGKLMGGDGGSIDLDASALFFDIGVYAVVVGATLLILTALAHQSVRAHKPASQSKTTIHNGAA